MSRELLIETNEVYKALGIVSRKVAEFENRIDSLSRENARLRELVRDAYDVACNYYACVGTADGLCDLIESMRELGIETGE